MTDRDNVKALEERIREWSGLDAVQQVFTDGYFKNTTAAGSAIFQAGEILADVKKVEREAEQRGMLRAAEIARCGGKGPGAIIEVPEQYDQASWGHGYGQSGADIYAAIERAAKEK